MDITYIESPNFDPTPPDVQFCILHYSALSLEKTISYFKDKKRGVSAHFVIDVDGSIYQCVAAMLNKTSTAWHAGESYWQDEARSWSRLNNYSIGIELINLNGNIFNYSQQQYKSLTQLLKALIRHYPALEDASRLLGHEQVSGFRGKLDPGRMFDWDRVWKSVYKPDKKPSRNAMIDILQIHGYDILSGLEGNVDELNSGNVNTFLESKAAEIVNKYKIDLK